jgi:hypothetical protein
MEKSINQTGIKWLRILTGTSLGLLLLLGSAARGRAAAGTAITNENVAQHIAAAKTAADHQALAAYYRSQASAAADEVKSHQAMLKSYDNVQGRSKVVMREHCERLIQSYSKEQKQYEDLTHDHEQLAKALESKAD